MPAASTSSISARIAATPGRALAAILALHALVWTALLVPLTLLLFPLRVAGLGYFITAAVLGTWLFAMVARGFSATSDSRRWAWSVFRGSLVYLSVLFVALSVNAT